MADINKSMEILKFLEHSNRNDKLLHYNKGEDGYTFFGIYEVAHPKWRGWTIIKRYLLIEPDIKKCSVILSNVTDLMIEVEKFYKSNFWDKAKLDLVNSQKIADEIFIFGVNTGMQVAIKKAQQLIGVTADGVVGPMTLKALNDFDESIFDLKFDELEKEYYDAIIKTKPYLLKNKQGWYNRADTV